MRLFCEADEIHASVQWHARVAGESAACPSVVSAHASRAGEAVECFADELQRTPVVLAQRP